MKQRVNRYLEFMEQKIQELDSKSELSEQDKQTLSIVKKEHVQQIQFFMHERQIHLFVMICVAILSMMTFLVLLIQFSLGLLILFAAFLVLLVPYIMHYYLLENSVQKMYEQYDQLEWILEGENFRDR